MTVEEQHRAAACVAEANAGSLPVIVGCGGTDTRQVCALAANAHRAGADAVLLSAPPYSRPPQRGLIDHFRRVMDAADLPAIIYNVPGRAAVNVLPDTIGELAEDPRVIGVKEASGDIAQIAELARIVGDRLAIWSGNDDQIVPILALGGRGVITVLGNVVPGDTSRMVHAWLGGDAATALALQLRYLPLVRALFAVSNPIPVKAAVNRLGFEAGPPRPPLCEASAAELDVLMRELEAAGVAVGRQAVS